MRHHPDGLETAVDGEADKAGRECVLPAMCLSNTLFDDESDAFGFTEEHEDVGEWDREGRCELRNGGEDICCGLEGRVEGGEKCGKVGLASGHCGGVTL